MRGKRQAAAHGTSLRFEPLEKRDMLTTLLVNFVRDNGAIDPVSAADFAVADANVDLTAPVNQLESGGGTGLIGTGGATFDVIDTGGSDWTTNKGVYEFEPILDSYLFQNGGSRTVTVAGLDEITGGQTVTVTLFGVGDASNQETEFTLNYNGATVGTAETDYGGSYLDTYVTFSFTKQVGVDQFEVEFQTAGNGSNTGAFNGFSVTTPSAVRINAGGDAHTDSEGNLFIADQYFSGGSQVFAVTDDIFIPGTGGTTANDEDVDDILYQTERYDGDLSYEIPIANGFYTLRLHYAELYHDDIGERIFDVYAEGALITDNLDIFEARQNAFTPGKFAALIQEFPLIEVTDGTMSLQFDADTDGVDNGKISAIEILQIDSPQLAVFQTDGSTTVLENGFTDTYDLALTVAPADDVVVTLSAGPEVTLDVTQVTFTPSNFDQPQTITVTAVDDTDQDGTEQELITHTLSSLDPIYDGAPAPSVSLTVLDNDSVEVDFNMRTIASSIPNPTAGTFGPDGRLYVATQNGQIRAYTLDGNNDVVATQTIDTIANESGYNNILGITFNPFEDLSQGQTPTIYVTRSALFLGTDDYGSRVSTLTGASYLTVTDIVTGLPVSGFDHGINGLQFDENGDLLIAVGGNTNTGVFDGIYGSQAPESPLTSAVLRARISEPTFNGNIQYEFIDPNDPELLALAASENDPNPDPNNQVYGNFVQVVDNPGEIEVETFAVGLRNPYDIVFTTDQVLFSTDNGPNGIAEDELNQILEGAFLGHPSIPRGKLDPRQTLENAEYDVNVPSDADYTAPLAELSSSTNGIDEYRAVTFGGQLQGQLFAQKYNGLVYFFERTDDGQDLENVNTRTDVGDGLDILAGPGGTIFGIDRNQNRVTLAEPVDLTVTTPTAYDVFPWRAPAAGGNPFTIGGANFGSLGNTTVTIGGVAATLTSVEDGKIVGILPPVPGIELTDIVVTSAGVTSTLVDAFLPLNGTPIVESADFDGDLDMDGSDFLAWQRGFNTGSGALPGDGDANGDQAVDVADYTIWTNQYGAASAIAASAFAASADVAGSTVADTNDQLIDASVVDALFSGNDEAEEPINLASQPIAESLAAATSPLSESTGTIADLPSSDTAADDAGEVGEQSESWLDDELLGSVFG